MKQNSWIFVTPPLPVALLPVEVSFNMSDYESNKSSFWTSLPGVLTGLAALVGALTTLYLAFHHIRPH
jgi:hypothetical protein